MSCRKCDGNMSAMGYGDMICDDCGHTEYSESDKDFDFRMYGVCTESNYCKECGSADIEHYKEYTHCNRCNANYEKIVNND